MKYWVGGKKRNNGMFAYFENGRMLMGSNHVPMTGIERNRFFGRNRLQKGRKVN